MRTRWIANIPDRILTSLSGADGVTGWVNGALVAGGYRSENGIGPDDDEDAFGVDLPSAKRQAFEPYLVSFWALVTGTEGTFAEAENYGRIYASASWQHVVYVLRWPATDSMLATAFRVRVSKVTLSPPTSVKIDQLSVVRMERSQYAQWSDTAMVALGADVPAYQDALTNMPTTSSILAAGGDLRIMMFGDSWSSATSYSPSFELLERSFPGVRGSLVNYAIGGSAPSTWNTPSGVDAMEAFVEATVPQIILYGCISTTFNSADLADWHELSGNLISVRDEYVPTADIMLASKLNGAGDSTDAFVSAICDEYGFGFWGAHGKYTEWYAAGGRMSLPDGTHPDATSRCQLGRSLAWRLGATAT